MHCKYFCQIYFTYIEKKSLLSLQLFELFHHCEDNFHLYSLSAWIYMIYIIYTFHSLLTTGINELALDLQLVERRTGIAEAMGA